MEKRKSILESHMHDNGISILFPAYGINSNETLSDAYTLFTERALPQPSFAFPVILHAYEYGRNAANPKNGVQELTQILLKRGVGADLSQGTFCTPLSEFLNSHHIFEPPPPSLERKIYPYFWGLLYSILFMI